MVAFVAAAVALPPGLSALASGPSSDERDASAHVTDGPVYAVAHQPGSNTYIGGDFNHVGPRSGHGLALSLADAEGAGGDRHPDWPELGSPAFPEVAGGEVHAVVSDQHGGWFIGGDFTSVGGHEIPRLAHIFRPDHPNTPGEVDTSWAPEPDDTVRALALDSFSDYPDRTGEWTLYVGGDFQNLESTEIFQRSNRDFLAAWRVNTDGAPDSPPPQSGTSFDNDEPLDWNAGQRTDNSVHALAVTRVTVNVGPDPAMPTLMPVVFAGGDFSTLGRDEALRNRVGAVWGEGAVTPDGASVEAQSLAWNPNAGTAAGTRVQALAIGESQESETTIDMPVYYGGEFTQFRTRLGASRFRLTKSSGDAASNLYTGWLPSPDQRVRALWLAGSTLYVGGDFETIGQPAAPIERLAAVDAVPADQVSDSGCDTSECPATPDPLFDPNPSGPVNAVVSSAGGDVVYAGGGFATIGSGMPEKRNGLAALDGSGQNEPGSVLPWDAGTAGGGINTLALQDDALYAGGDFFSVGAEERDNLAVLDPQGAVSDELTLGTTCQPVGDETACLDKVEALELSPDRESLFVGGGFTKLGRDGDWVDRCHLGAVDLAADAVTDWDPSPNRAADGSEGDEGTPPHRDTGDVMSLAAAGERLYVGGHFDRVGARAAPGGTDEPCDPPDPTQPARAGLAVLDLETGEPLDWDPDPKRLGPGGEEPFNVYDIEASCDTVYTGGSFNRIGAAGSGSSQPTRTSIAELDPDTAAATPWNPNPDGHPGAVRALALHGDVLYVGGGFSQMGRTPDGGTAIRRRIAAVRRSDGSATSWNPSADGAVHALGISGDGQTVYAGGIFDGFRNGTFVRWGLAALQADGVGNGFGDPTGWDPSAREPGTVTPQRRSNVWALAAAGDNVYVGGEFTDIGTSAQRGYAQFSGGGESSSAGASACESQDQEQQRQQTQVSLPDTAPPLLGQAFVADGGKTLVLSLSETGAVHVDLTGSMTGIKLLKRGASGKKQSSSSAKRRASKRKRSSARLRCVPSTSKNLALLRRQLRERLGTRKWRKVPRRKRAERLRKLAAKRACSAPIQPRSIDATGWPGQNRISLAATRPLPPGTYRASVVVRDAAGNSAAPVGLDFEVKE